MARQVQATLTYELGILVTGSFQPGAPETPPSYASGGEPAEPEMIEDLEITDLRLECLAERGTETRPAKWTAHSLFGDEAKCLEAVVKAMVKAQPELMPHNDCTRTLIGRAAMAAMRTHILDSVLAMPNVASEAEDNLLLEAAENDE